MITAIGLYRVLSVRICDVNSSFMAAESLGYSKSMRRIFFSSCWHEVCLISNVLNDPLPLVFGGIATLSSGIDERVFEYIDYTTLGES